MLCADRPETFLGLRKIKEKKKTSSLENHCCSPRKISSALHSSVAISWLMTAVSLDRSKHWKSAHLLAFLLPSG